MSKYTVQVRWLVENNYDLGLNDYPIFDESYRTVLNNKILEHYMFREIGFETPTLFKRFLRRTLNEIMPYYNQLYKSELIVFNPMYDADLNTTYTKTSTGNNTTNVTQDANGSHDKTVTNDGTGSNDSNGTNNTHYIGDSTDTKDSTLGNDNTVTYNTSDKNTHNTTDTENKTVNNKKVHSETPSGLLSIGNIEGDVYASNADIESNTDTNTLTKTGDDTLNKTGTVANNTSGTNHGTDVVHSESNNDITTTNHEEGTTHNTEHDSGTTHNSGTSNATTDITNTDEYTQHVMGNKGTKNFSQLLNDFRSTFLNIDMMIIEDKEMQSLFMDLW